MQRLRIPTAAATHLVRKRHFLSHLYIKINILPRQARDNHRENSKKVPFSYRASMPNHVELLGVCAGGDFVPTPANISQCKNG